MIKMSRQEHTYSTCALVVSPELFSTRALCSLCSPSPAVPAPRQRQEVHLAQCPGGADHVARTVLGHFYPGVGGIWNCPWRYSLIKIWSKLKNICVWLFKFFLLRSFYQRPDRRSRWWVDHILLLSLKTVDPKPADVAVMWSPFLRQCRGFVKKLDSNIY